MTFSHLNQRIGDIWNAKNIIFLIIYKNISRLFLPHAVNQVSFHSILTQSVKTISTQLVTPKYGKNMNHIQKSKARLYFTYLKDKTELLLYVRPHGTSGSEISYRRAPGDEAINKRIKSILDHSKISIADTEIWILLYPPEIYTTTMYVPAHANASELKALIHEQIFSTLYYPVRYDWENYRLTIHENREGENMVTVTILGKDVLPRIHTLLSENYGRVRFIGDGLQFLNVGSTFFEHLWGKTYNMILPYDEVYFQAAFRSGVHVESSVLTHAASSTFGEYKLAHQQVYLDFREKKNILHQPQIQPVVSIDTWREACLTSSAFPSWFIACNSLKQSNLKNFIKNNSPTGDIAKQKKDNRKLETLHLLD